MALRGKKPELKPTRFKALLFGEQGAGKTHFCCSLPGVYYIDTENSTDKTKYTKMLQDHPDSVVATINDLEDIVEEIKELMKNPGHYKTVVIDSITPPYALMGIMEAARLSKDGRDGMEYQRHLNKAKKLVYYLGILLSRIDMNVIVTAHHKVKYENGEAAGDTYDSYNKIGYMLDCEICLKVMGASRKGMIHKSRYEELPQNKLIDFTAENIMALFGSDVFTNESVAIEFTTDEQEKELKRLFKLMGKDDEYVNKILSKAKALDIKDLDKDKAQKWIDTLIKQVEGDAE